MCPFVMTYIGICEAGWLTKTKHTNNLFIYKVDANQFIISISEITESKIIARSAAGCDGREMQIHVDRMLDVFRLANIVLN